VGKMPDMDKVAAQANRTGRKVMMVVGMRSLEEFYRNVRR
jgi:hypothetical protein